MVIQKGSEFMKPRIGRPTAAPKTHETRVRMSDEDVAMLEYCAKTTGKSKSDIIREGIKEVYNRIKKNSNTAP